VASQISPLLAVGLFAKDLLSSSHICLFPDVDAMSFRLFFLGTPFRDVDFKISGVLFLPTFTRYAASFVLFPWQLSEL
jgi:hypothetical protein